MTQIRFAAIGLDHGHIIGMTNGMLEAGAICVGYWTAEDAASKDRFNEKFPDITRVEERERLLEDPLIDMILIAAQPQERAALAIEAMHHGKDVMVDKPACVTLSELRAIKKAVKETGRIWSVYFSERFVVPAVTVASEMVREGRIGQVVQVLGLGPHRGRFDARPDWFYDRKRYGGILADIASHQIDQFLHFTGSEDARIVHSAVGNIAHPEHPEFEDFGEINLVSGFAQGYIRVDWFTPDALPNWGDGRLFILGTEGTIELRKYLDFCGRDGTNHLFLVNGSDYEYRNCVDDDVPYFRDLCDDILTRGEKTCPQAHTFKVMELAISAQMQAEQRGYL